MEQRPFRLLYDGQCPFCRSEVQWLSRRDRRGSLVLEDISRPDFDPSQYALTREAVSAVLHGIMPDGRVVRRLEAVAEAYKAAGIGWLARPLMWPGVHWIADRMYGLFARYRVPLGRLLGGPAQCETNCRSRLIQKTVGNESGHQQKGAATLRRTMLGVAAISASFSMLLGAKPMNFAFAESFQEAPATDPEFTPQKEAELPKGFPSYTKVGAIEVKQYPAYRKATSSGAAAFWSLFRHISNNGIKMTAPVELTYGQRKTGSVKEENMAFLYGNPDMGRKGSHGAVEVTDIPAATVLSTGVRGARTDASVKQALDRLRAWLDANQVDYAEVGPPRVMAYNSPFVPRDRQFFEVQIPVKPQR